MRGATSARHREPASPPDLAAPPDAPGGIPRAATPGMGTVLGRERPNVSDDDAQNSDMFERLQFLD